MIAASSSSGGVSSLPPAQVAPCCDCERLGALVVRARERVDLAALVDGGLADHVRRGPEPVQPEPVRVAGQRAATR